MKVSTKGRYGLKAMVYIGMNSKESCVSLRSISEFEGISENYLEQLIAQLKKNNLVKSVRGAHGGYKLARDPKEISIGDILRALEGDVITVKCISGEDTKKDCGCGNNCGSDCRTKDVWQKLSDTVSETVDSIYLDSLL